nr:MAG TPA: hypothetical protein [Caudoviricetes sp.]
MITYINRKRDSQNVYIVIVYTFCTQYGLNNVDLE